MQQEHPRETILPEGSKERRLLNKLNDFRITPEILRRILPHITCDLCKKQIDDIEVHHFQWNRFYIIRGKCHGKEEDCKITEIEFVEVMKDKCTTLLFKQPDPAKQLTTEQLKMENSNAST